MSIPTPERPHISKVAGGVENIVRSNETMLVSGVDGKFWVQNGRVYDEGGKPVDEVPEWFWEEFAKLTPAMQAKHGGRKGIEAAMSGSVPDPDAELVEALVAEPKTGKKK